MGERHRHADVIIAWANGEEIQYRAMPGEGGWETFPRKAIITWCEYAEYRVKPIIVTKAGWVNVYKSGPAPTWSAFISQVHHTKEDADKYADINRVYANSNRVDCIRIEWEEEV